MLLSGDYIHSHWNRASFRHLRHLLYVPSTTAIKKSYGLVCSLPNETTHIYPSELEQFFSLFSLLFFLFLCRIETEIRGSNVIFVLFCFFLQDIYSSDLKWTADLILHFLEDRRISAYSTLSTSRLLNYYFPGSKETEDN